MNQVLKNKRACLRKEIRRESVKDLLSVRRRPVQLEECCLCQQSMSDEFLSNIIVQFRQGIISLEQMRQRLWLVSISNPSNRQWEQTGLLQFAVQRVISEYKESKRAWLQILCALIWNSTDSISKPQSYQPLLQLLKDPELPIHFQSVMCLLGNLVQESPDLARKVVELRAVDGLVVVYLNSQGVRTGELLSWFFSCLLFRVDAIPLQKNQFILITNFIINFLTRHEQLFKHSLVCLRNLCKVKHSALMISGESKLLQAVEQLVIERGECFDCALQIFEQILSHQIMIQLTRLPEIILSKPQDESGFLRRCLVCCSPTLIKNGQIPQLLSLLLGFQQTHLLAVAQQIVEINIERRQFLSRLRRELQERGVSLSQSLQVSLCQGWTQPT